VRAAPENAAAQTNFTRYANAVRGSDAFMNPALLDAPEVVIPSDVRIRFFRSCDSEQLGAYSEAWDPVLKAMAK
jgi:spermidine/putrescine transport system substrate-binding protein